MLILALPTLLLTAHLLLTYPGRRLHQAANDTQPGSSMAILLVIFLLVSAVIALSAPTLPFVLALRYIRGARVPFATLLFSNLRVIRDIVIAAIVGLAHLLFIKYVSPRIYRQATGKQTLLVGLGNMLLAPFVEEIVFRGYGRMFCDAHHISSPLAALLTAGLFAAPHAHMGDTLTAPSFRAASINLLEDVVFGVLFYYLYLATNSLMTPMLSHFAVNTVSYFYSRRKDRVTAAAAA